MSSVVAPIDDSTAQLAVAARALDAAPSPIPTALPGSIAPAASQSALEGVARVHRAHVRLLAASGQVLLDHDYDFGRDLSERAGGVVLGRKGALDAAHALVSGNEGLAAVIAKGGAEGCEDGADNGMVVCYAARVIRGAGEVRVLHVQDSAQRPLPLLYALRFQLGRLTLVITPFALLLAAHLVG